jgi:hypothetical protein
MIFSLVQIQKTRLESRALALNLRKEEQALGIERPFTPLTTTPARRAEFVIFYSLFPTGVMGFYTLIFRGTSLLPISDETASVVLTVILPTLVAQLTMASLWLRDRRSPSSVGIMPLWVISAPSLATALFGAAVWAFALQHTGLSPRLLIDVVALSAALVGSATIRITTLIVPAPKDVRTVDITSAFNRIGISTEGTSLSTGGLDGGGKAYSASQLGSPVAWNGVSFNLGPPDGLDVVSCMGQTLPLTAGKFGSLMMLGTGVNGNQPSQVFKVNYSDGTTVSFSKNLSDWATPQQYSGESMALTMTYCNAGSGAVNRQAHHLYGYVFDLDDSKTVISLKVPSNENVEVIGLALSRTQSVTTLRS